MKDYCEIAINEGQIDKLVCPCVVKNKKCGSHIREIDLNLLELDPTVMNKYT
jgi:hypothetical protein